MYRKFNNLINILVGLIGVSIILILFLVFNFPATTLLIVLAVLVVLGCLLAFSVIAKLKVDISNINNVVPYTTAQAISFEKLLLITYDKTSKEITWVNDQAAEVFKDINGQSIENALDGHLKEALDDGKHTIEYNDHYYSVVSNKETLVLKDVTDKIKALQLNEQNKLAQLSIRIDSLDDMSDSLDETNYLNLVNDVRETISDFADEFDSILRRTKTDSYVMFVKAKEVPMVIDRASEMLDKLRASSNDDEDTLTVSIGLAYGYDQLKEVSYQAGEALDVALARGGDQIVIKEIDQAYRFIGGHSESNERRTRVKVKMLASGLESLVKQASNVVIMGHQNADMDALGSAYGIAKFVRVNNKKAYIVCDTNSLEASTQIAYEQLNLHEEHLLYRVNEVMSIIDEQTLLIIVDASNIDLLESKKVYDAIDKKVVIDHHRRGDNFIDKPLLVFVESYASSTVEMVSELLRFQSKNYKLGNEVATLMLAGMMVDTDFFTTRTGVRTFDAAADLRNHGANPTLANELLLVNKDTYQKRLAIVSDAIYIDDKYAIATYDKEPLTRALLAQAAIEMLEIKGIVASFVIGYIGNNKVGISARSNGEFNVQSILEKFNGGGHFSMAAAQIDSNDIQGVQAQLVEILEGLEGEED